MNYEELPASNPLPRLLRKVGSFELAHVTFVLCFCVAALAACGIGGFLLAFDGLK